MRDAPLRVDGERLRADLEALAEIGRLPGGGIDRRAFGPAELAARDWFRERVVAAGLAPHDDPAGNLSGVLESRRRRPVVMTGSHLDTVPGGGPLDGAYGVVAGLECLRRIRELELELERPLEVVAFADEEGRFGGMLGSLAMAGALDVGEVTRRVDPKGNPLSEALREAGLDPEAVPEARRDPRKVHAFVELHIEQGPVLATGGQTIGVVTSIAGLFRWSVTFRGEANHAGTTPMALRRDAFQGAARFATALPRVLARAGGPNSVATIGRLSLEPGAPNVVPGEARLTLDVRDPDPEVLAALDAALRDAADEAAGEGLEPPGVDVLSEIPPVPCADRVVDLVEEEARRLDLSHRRMHSGAAHDAQQLARLAPMGMVFVPSEGGRSHCPDERTSWESLEAGASVLLNTLVRLAET